MVARHLDQLRLATSCSARPAAAPRLASGDIRLNPCHSKSSGFSATLLRFSSLLQRSPWMELTPIEYRTASQREQMRTSAGTSFTPARHRLHQHEGSALSKDQRRRRDVVGLALLRAPPIHQEIDLMVG